MTDSDDDTSVGGASFLTVKVDTKHVTYPVLKGDFPSEEKAEAWEMHIMLSFELAGLDHIVKTDCKIVEL